MLESKRVEDVFMDCLFEDGEDTSNHILVEGITSKVGFNPNKINLYNDEITKMLMELPKEFHSNSGGGMSFLNACNDKNGRQWTDFHQRMEQLFQLGLAIGKVKCLMPRDMWKVLPGGMPYYVIESEPRTASQS
jgi:hypothetical protein